MFQSISTIHCGRFCRINSLGAVNASRFNDGQVQARLKSGGTTQAQFGGFVEISNLVGVQRVKLVGISSVCTDLDGLVPGYRIPNNHYVLGIYLERKLFVATIDGQIKHELETQFDDDGKNNVVRLF